MNKKIAVLGHRNAMDGMIRFIDDSIDRKFVFIRNEADVDGFEFSDYILLDRWHESYRSPKSILEHVIRRIR